MTMSRVCPNASSLMSMAVRNSRLDDGCNSAAYGNVFWGTSRHQNASEEPEENKKSLKIVMFDSQVSLHSQ